MRRARRLAARAAARGAGRRGASASSSSEARRGRAASAPRRAELAGLGVEVRFGGPWTLPAGHRPGRHRPAGAPHHPLLAAARAAGIEVIGEVELAWRLRPAGAAPVARAHRHQRQDHRRAHAHRHADRRRAQGRSPRATWACPIVEAVARAVRRPRRRAVQLPAALVAHARPARRRGAQRGARPPRLARLAGGVRRATRAQIFERAGTVRPQRRRRASPAPLADARTRARGRASPCACPGPGSSAWSRTCSSTGRSWPTRAQTAEELASLADVRPLAPHNVANALAAAALARAYGVPAERRTARACATSSPDPHRHRARGPGRRGRLRGRLQGHQPARRRRRRWPPTRRSSGSPAASSRAPTSTTWYGGPRRGCAARCCSAPTAAGSREALARHAPNVPVVEVSGQDTGVMDRVVTEAAALAAPGDTVLLAPAGASLDMFAGYPARGEAFARAVRALEADAVSTATRERGERSPPGRDAARRRPGSASRLARARRSCWSGR